MPIEIDTAVTPSLHPANVESISGYDAETAPAVVEVLGCFRIAYDALSDVHAARKAAASNPVLTDAARLLQVADFADKHQNTVTRKFDAARANLVKAITALDASLNEPLKLRAERPSIAAEVRAHVKALTSEQREAWFNERQRAGDMESLEMVLGVPGGYLSGMSDDERAIRTRMYHEMRQPIVAKRLKVMGAALEMLETRGPLLFKEMEKAVGASSRKVAALRSAKTTAEAAFILKDKSAA